MRKRPDFRINTRLKYIKYSDCRIALRVSKSGNRQAAAAKEIIRKHSEDFAGTLDDTDVIKLASISRNSYKRELRAE